MNRPSLFLTVGLPGTGKTTIARQLEAEHEAMRLTKDEWMKALYGDENPSSASDVIEGRLIQVGMRALELGINVIIDFGLWSRYERAALRHAAAEIGATVVLQYCELEPEEQRRRLERRQAETPHGTWPMSEHELTQWASKIDIPTAAEIDGSEPVGPPPDGFSTWRDGPNIAGHPRGPDFTSQPTTPTGPCDSHPTTRPTRSLSSTRWRANAAGPRLLSPTH